MRTQAVSRFVRVSPRKARLVLRELQGRSVGEALGLLQYVPRAAARLVEKTLRSAIANAEHNHQVRNLDDLRIAKAVADRGPVIKRIQPRAMGRAFFIRHRTSHITVVLSDEVPQPAPGQRTAAGRVPAERVRARAGQPRAARGSADRARPRAAAEG
ncbi:MAG: 50S ribosomal protein L22 [Candidatus Rokubacteria bacterium]|nr:50S ribosomal protein L22 [Candidatus Rokubacteria bacterium]